MHSIKGRRFEAVSYVVTTVQILISTMEVKSCSKICVGDILVPTNPGSPGNGY